MENNRELHLKGPFDSNIVLSLNLHCSNSLFAELNSHKMI